jgi:hypothetical protein
LLGDLDDGCFWVRISRSRSDPFAIDVDGAFLNEAEAYEGYEEDLEADSDVDVDVDTVARREYGKVRLFGGTEYDEDNRTEYNEDGTRNHLWFQTAHRVLYRDE